MSGCSKIWFWGLILVPAQPITPKPFCRSNRQRASLETAFERRIWFWDLIQVPARLTTLEGMSAGLSALWLLCPITSSQILSNFQDPNEWLAHHWLWMAQIQHLHWPTGQCAPGWTRAPKGD